MTPFLQPVSPLELDWTDATFAVSGTSASVQTALESSLEAHGVLQPPWLLATAGGPFVIVDGFKRVRWLREHRADEAEPLACMVFPAGTDRRALWLRRLEEKLFGPPLNGAEKAGIVHRMASWCEPREMTRRILPSLGIAGREETFDRWRRLGEAQENLLTALAAGDITDRAALELVGWDEPACGAGVALLRELRCSASIQMEILERVAEIALRDGRAKTAVMRAPEMEIILHDQGQNHRQKTQAMRHLLTRWRFPRLQAREERFLRETAELGLSRAVRIVPPSAFEGEEWQVHITFTSSEDLSVALDEAGRLASSSALQKLMAPGSSSGGAPEAL